MGFDGEKGGFDAQRREGAKVTPKQERFVEEYLVDLSAKHAAIRAGYSAKTAKAIGCENLAKPDIAAAIAKAKAARSKRTAVSQDWVLNHIHGTVERCLGKGDAFQPAAALKGLDLAGKHLGMFTTTLRHAGHDGGPLSPDSLTTLELARKVAFSLAAGAEAEKAEKAKKDD